jgi:hypothetical protein
VFPSRHKYRNKKVEVDGIRFDSKLEANCYKEILASGLNFSRQEVFEIQEKFKDGTKTVRPIKYVADFLIKHNGVSYVLDSKGMKTPEFMLKYKLLLYRGTRVICVGSAKKMREACIYIIEGKTPLELQSIIEAKKKKNVKKGA